MQFITVCSWDLCCSFGLIQFFQNQTYQCFFGLFAWASTCQITKQTQQIPVSESLSIRLEGLWGAAKCQKLTFLKHLVPFLVGKRNKVLSKMSSPSKEYTEYIGVGTPKERCTSTLSHGFEQSSDHSLYFVSDIRKGKKQDHMRLLQLQLPDLVGFGFFRSLSPPKSPLQPHNLKPKASRIVSHEWYLIWDSYGIH